MRFAGDGEMIVDVLSDLVFRLSSGEYSLLCASAVPLKAV